MVRSRHAGNAPVSNKCFGGNKVAKKVIGFGDMLISLNPPGYLRFVQTDTLEVNYTGAEANVLVSLSQFGMKTELVTRLPQNAIANCALAHMHKYAVGTQHVQFGGERMGVVYIEKGAAQRPSQVVYDRSGTAICQAQPGSFDWGTIFENAEWFHFTGITAALSDSTAQLCMEAVQTAQRHGLCISCDLNYRKKLWSVEKAKSVMEKLVPYVNVLIANEEDADKMLGIRATGTDVEKGHLNREGYVDVAQQIHRAYGCKYVAITLRRSISASDNEWSAMLFDGEETHFSRTYPIHIVNRVGGGDSFAAGLIYALSSGRSTNDAIEFAAAASCLKHSIEQDFNLVTVAEVDSLVDGNASGRVQR